MSVLMFAPRNCMESYKTLDMIVGDIIDKNPKLLIGYCHQGVLTHKLRVLLLNTSKLGNTEDRTVYSEVGVESESRSKSLRT